MTHYFIVTLASARAACGFVGSPMHQCLGTERKGVRSDPVKCRIGLAQ